MFKNIKICMCALLLLLPLSGCGEEVVKPNDKGGTLIVNENENEINLAVTSFDTFNPIMTRSESVSEFLENVYEPLFEYDEHYNPMPVLAEEYTLSANGLVASFRVKKVYFHDSTPLSAKDVVYTVNMIKNTDSIYSDNVKYIKSIYSDEAGRVYMELTKPVVNFTGVLNFPIVKDQTPMEYDSNFIPVGTGPCKYYGKRTTNEWVFTSNEAWHGGETGFKNVLVNIFKDEFTVTHAFDAGEVDVLASKFIKSEEISPRSEHTKNEYITNSLTFLGINNTSPKLGGKYTKKALEMLCDRQRIVDVEVYSKGQVAKVPINPSAWFYPEIAEETRDLEAIKGILQKDGWKKDESGYFRDYEGARQDLTLRILVNKDNEEKVRIAKNISESFKSFGIGVSLTEVDFDRYREEVSQMNYELFIGEVLMDESLDPSFLTTSSGNYFGYQNPVLDEILGEMARTSDTSSIMAWATKYGEVFNDEVPFIPLFFRKETVIYNKNIAGIAPPNNCQIYRDIDKWYISKTK